MLTNTLTSTRRSPDLVYVLAEGWDGGELADEVEVGGGEGVNSTAVKNWQSLVRGQSQVLHGEQRRISTGTLGYKTPTNAP